MNGCSPSSASPSEEPSALSIASPARATFTEMTHDPTPRLRLIYDENAHAYEQANRGIDPTTRDFALTFVSALAAGAEVLDVGCGTGKCSALFTDLGFAVTGIDISPVMLALARERSPKSTFLEMDMRHLDFPDARFEGLWASAAFLHLTKEDAPAALAEFRRVLRAGAPLAVTVKTGEGEGWEPSPYGAFERFYSRYGAKEIARLFAPSFNVRSITHATDRGEEWLLVSATAR